MIVSAPSKKINLHGFFPYILSIARFDNHTREKDKVVETTLQENVITLECGRFNEDNKDFFSQGLSIYRQ